MSISPASTAPADGRVLQDDMRLWFVSVLTAAVIGACRHAHVTAPVPGATSQLAARINKFATDRDFHGLILVGQDDRVQFLQALGQAAPGSDHPLTINARWRWASISKQITAALIMQEVAAGRLGLDDLVSRHLPAFNNGNAATLTVRHLLRHQSGLANPDSPTVAQSTDGLPTYYQPTASPPDPLLGVCAGDVTGPPGGNWSYNNCDFIVAGRILTKVTGMSLAQLLDQRLSQALAMRSVQMAPFGATVPGFVGGKPEPAYALERFEASAAITGTIEDLWRFDQALMKGSLVPAQARAEMWRGDPTLGYIALGQWVFPARLAGCAGDALEVVERRGAIGGVEVRNFLVPERKLAVIMFANRSDVPFGEIWSSEGLSYDVLSAAACLPH